MNFDERLKSFLDISQILKDESMKKHTSFRIGGIADYFIIVKSVNELIELLNVCKEYKKDYFIIGNGTNLLVTDKGIRGVVIKLKLEEYKINFENQYGTIEVESRFFSY